MGLITRRLGLAKTERVATALKVRCDHTSPVRQLVSLSSNRRPTEQGDVRHIKLPMFFGHAGAISQGPPRLCAVMPQARRSAGIRRPGAAEALPLAGADAPTPGPDISGRTPAHPLGTGQVGR